MEATINAAMLRWVSPAQAVNDVRTYLKGILVEPAPQGACLSQLAMAITC